MSGTIRGRVAIVQMDCVLGEIQPNLEKIGHFAEAAGRLGADLVLLPECATTGYFIADRLNELADTLRELAGSCTAERLGIGNTPSERMSSACHSKRNCMLTLQVSTSASQVVIVPGSLGPRYPAAA